MITRAKERIYICICQYVNTPVEFQFASSFQGRSDVIIQIKSKALSLMQSTKRFNHALNAFDLCATSN
jgi:hypothetical protein